MGFGIRSAGSWKKYKRVHFLLMVSYFSSISQQIQLIFSKHDFKHFTPAVYKQDFVTMKYFALAAVAVTSAQACLVFSGWVSDGLAVYGELKAVDNGVTVCEGSIESGDKNLRKL
jgi:hypothetical protein